MRSSAFRKRPRPTSSWAKSAPVGGRLERERSHQIMLKVEDVATAVEDAVARGARLVEPQRDREYGERQATVDDPFGHHWVLNQTLADVAPEVCGGRSGAAAQ